MLTPKPKDIVNLYLSSFRLGDRKVELTKLIPRRRLAFIGNALDYLEESVRRRVVQRGVDDLRELGIDSEVVDLRDYFNGAAKVGSALADYDAVFVSGGNVFVLRRAMQRSGFDTYLSSRSEDDAFLYAGYSAGACVAAPTLRGLDMVDDPAVTPPGYTRDILWDGLGLAHYSIVPHWRSNHGETKEINVVVDYLLEHKMLFRALRDGEVLIESSTSPGHQTTGRG